MTSKKLILLSAFRITIGIIGTVLGSSAMAAMITVLTVKNTDPGSRILSDLVVLGAGANDSQILLQPSNASDNITLLGGGQTQFFVNFPVTSYHISMTLPNGSEVNTTYLKLLGVVKGAKDIAFVQAQGANQGIDLFALLDFDLAVNQPPSGTLLDFTIGINPQLPGWFIGTATDFNTGAVTGAYTGRAQVVLDGIRVTVAVSEPSSLNLVGLALAGCLLLSRKKKFERVKESKGPIKESKRLGSI